MDILEFPWMDIRGVLLPYQTRGAAETLYIILRHMDPCHLERRSISLDCDTLYFTDVLAQFRALEPGMGCTFYFEDTQDKPMYSYIQLDAHNQVTNMREKVKISHHANTGAYGFSSGITLCKACEEVLDAGTGQAGEYYTSSVIAHMMRNEHTFKGIFVPRFECLGTPHQLEDFLRKTEVSRAVKAMYALLLLLLLLLL